LTANGFFRHKHWLMPAPRTDRRVAWITGAAGGLGQELVREFLRQDWHVAAMYHRTPLPEPPGTSLFSVQGDVTDQNTVSAAVKRILERWGRVDLLINNAGHTRDRLCSQLTESEWNSVLDVNLKGAFICARAVLPFMVRERSGQIINISSYAGRVGRAGQSNYAAAKAGLLGLTQSLAAETGSCNVRVNAVLPGILLTGLTDTLSSDQLNCIARENVLGRINQTAEVGRFIAFLATLENVSGQIFQMDSRIAPAL
jgi:3-oxoacyl-[acyl-carrier protein] reductase